MYTRRTALKALAGLPILGIFGLEVFRNREFTKSKKNRAFKELGLDNLNVPFFNKSSLGSNNDLLRIGIIGFGSRAQDLAQALGFMHPEDTENKRRDNALSDWLEQDYLNVSVTGICDVFDLHAERGLATARNMVRPGGAKALDLPVKRFLRYEDMLEDKDIDAVIIATPDHHHARMTIDAIKAGKHVYCEKSVAHSEAELMELYEVVRNSKQIYQLGHQITQNAVFHQAKEIIKKEILGKITLVETTTNRNTAEGAWIRNLDANGNPKPGNEKSIDWKQWLGSTPYVPFSIDRYYNWTKWFAYDTGMIGQLFTHEFDAINQLLGIGIPHSVVSSGGIYYWKDNREIPDVLHCVFEYPDHEMTLVYSASLANSRSRGRVFMGSDASMELGGSLNITADVDSVRYKKLIKEGVIDPSAPMISIQPGSGKIDAVTSATQKYYASRGLTTTNINGHTVNVTHLHIKEWLDCIRNGGTPSANIDRAFEEGVACLMAHRSYLEKRRVTWDPIRKAIV
jgi:predicted dehydrogenase